MSTRLDTAFSFLSENHVLSLALSHDDEPHCCSLMYAHRGFDVFWVSDPASRHSQIIDAAPAWRAAATIAPDYNEFSKIRGLQLIGTVSRVEKVAETSAAMRLFAKRYSFFSELYDRPATLAAAMLKSKVYCLVPDKVTLIDNTESFGSKTTFGPEDLARLAPSKRS